MRSPDASNQAFVAFLKIALVLQQQFGVFFSGEFTKTNRLKNSHLQTLWWAGFEVAQVETFLPGDVEICFSFMRQWDDLLEYMTAFGLFPEPLGLRDGQATFDSSSLPLIARTDSKKFRFLFLTPDGACLFPRHKTIRIASGDPGTPGRYIRYLLAWYPTWYFVPNSWRSRVRLAESGDRSSTLTPCQFVAVRTGS